MVKYNYEKNYIFIINFMFIFCYKENDNNYVFLAKDAYFIIANVSRR